MAAPMAMRRPVVVILGATGTGKSKLSLDIARIFKGEIISADSMQVYKGLDIITNKVRTTEQDNIPHHLIDYVSPLKENSTVVDFRNTALPLIDSLLQRNKLPVVVGGTFYYIESLLWKYLINNEDIEKASAAMSCMTTGLVHNTEPCIDNRLSSESRDTVVTMETTQHRDRVPVEGEREGSSQCRDTEMTDGRSSDSSSSDGEDCVAVRKDRDKYEGMKAADLYQRLLEVDSVSARKLHPKDKRKIIRSLEVYDEHGVPMSEIYDQQHRDVGSHRAFSGPLRYTDTCVFWIQCNMDVLDERLERRVDSMLDEGLVQELTDFHNQYNRQRFAENKEADYTRGIFQSIGFKEFHNYLILPEAERDTDKGRKLLQKGTYELKLVTKRYARRQVRCIRNRLLKRPSSNVLPMYALDGTDVSRWDELVTRPAVGVLESLMQGSKPSLEPVPYEGERTEEYAYNECTICGKTFVLESIWKQHLQSRSHKKRVAGHRKRLENTTKILDQALADARRSRGSDETNQT